ncbi:hypothetical protein RRG08_052385, partial [Elysia crispata]
IDRGTCTEPSVALLLHKALVQDREDQQFSDFSVTVDEVEFKCHRLVLSTRSGFFRSLLTSGMKETTEGKATLQSISSDVFAIVLKWIYEGEANLSEENVIDVLFAADQLDVQSLVSQCQYLLMQNLSLENCIRFYHTSKVFNHKELEEKSWKILLENFDCVCISDEFYTLNTDEILSVVSDPRLNTRSEDVVIESILRWVHFDAGQVSDNQEIEKNKKAEGDKHHAPIHPKSGEIGAFVQGNGSAEPAIDPANHDRSDTAAKCGFFGDCKLAETEGLTTSTDYVDLKNHQPRLERLADVLEASRYLLVSGNCVWQTLACDPLVQADRRCRAIQEEIIRYKTRLDSHQSALLSAAENRWPGYLRDVLISHTNDKLYYINFRLSHKWQEINLDCPVKGMQCLVYFDSNIYVTGVKKQVHVYTPINMKWLTLTSAEHESVQTLAMLPVGNELVAVHTSGNGSYIVERLSIQSVGPAKWLQVGEFLMRGMEVASITNIGPKLIVFWRQPGQNCVSIECFDLIQRKSFFLPDQLTVSSSLATFKHGDDVFALQENGSLWRISLLQSQPYLSLKHELCLWNFHRAVAGAILARGILMVFETSTESRENAEAQAEARISLENVFTEIEFIKSSPAQKSYLHSVLYLNHLNQYP